MRFGTTRRSLMFNWRNKERLIKRPHASRLIIIPCRRGVQSVRCVRGVRCLPWLLDYWKSLFRRFALQGSAPVTMRAASPTQYCVKSVKKNKFNKFIMMTKYTKTFVCPTHDYPLKFNSLLPHTEPDSCAWAEMSLCWQVWSIFFIFPNSDSILTRLLLCVCVSLT